MLLESVIKENAWLFYQGFVGGKLLTTPWALKLDSIIGDGHVKGAPGLDSGWIVDAHRDDGKCSIVHTDENLTAFVELQKAIHEFAVSLIPSVREIQFAALMPRNWRTCCVN